MPALHIKFKRDSDFLTLLGEQIRAAEAAGKPELAAALRRVADMHRAEMAKYVMPPK